MFRFLSSLFLALAALFTLRLLFATARRVNRARESDRVAPPRSDAGPRGVGTARPPRIDSTLAEDVPFVEVEADREKVPRD